MLKLLGFMVIIHSSVSTEPASVLSEEIFTYHAETYQKAIFAYEVVNKIYNSFQQWYFTIAYCEFTYFENRILKYTENYGNGYPVLLVNSCPDANTTKVKPKYNIHGQTAYLVTSEDLTIEGSEYVIKALKRTGVFYPRSAVIFVINIPVDIDKYFFYTLKSHFQLLCSRRVTNSVLVLWSLDENRLRMYTYNPFFDELKDITDVQDISHLLSAQYDDLFGRKLRLSVFRKIYISNETGPILCDSRLTVATMSYLNATCKPLVPRDGSTVGDLLDNGTATGVTADLINGYTDLELSSRILKTTYYGYIDTTYPLTQDELCFIVQKSDKQSTFATTINLISGQILLIFSFNVLFFLVLTILVRKFEKKIWNINDKQSTGSSVMDLVKCLLRQTVDIKFLGPVFRSLALIIIIYSLIINCAIDGIITSAITYPRYKPDINTITELALTNLTIGVHTRDYGIFNKSLSPEYYNLFKNRIQIINDQKIKDFVDNRQFEYAILLRKTDANYITKRPANMKNGRQLFHIVPDCPVPCFIVYGLRYGSPYLTRINNILHHLNQAGILKYWNEVEEYSLYRHQLVTTTKGIKALNIANLQEIFYVLVIGLLVSTLVFVLEILASMYKK